MIEEKAQSTSVPAIGESPEGQNQMGRLAQDVQEVPVGGTKAD